MEKLLSNNETILKFDVKTLKDVHSSISKIFNEFKLPEDKKKTILLKPNLNNDMLALTGGTTDLRIIVAVIMALKKRGYKKIVIGDGPNTGIFHAKLDVFSRLRIKEIAKRFNISYIDFNNSDYIEQYIGSHKTRIAKICYDAFLINMPKIKTHTEAKLSCCMKNLVGCNIGLNKRAVHWDLTRNIVELNKILKPDLNIVDGLIAMEGDGPSKGTPKKLNLMLAGKNSFILDYYVSRLTNIKNIPYLDYARELGLLQEDGLKFDNKYNIKNTKSHFIVNFLLGNYFVLPRYWKIFNWFFDLNATGYLLSALNIRQDIYDNTEVNAEIKKISNVNKNLDDICPVMLKISDKNFKFDSKCIKCMYCYMVSENIKAYGNIGFLKSQEKVYSRYWNNI